MTGHAGYFILLNVAMGGAFPNGVAGLGDADRAHRPGRPMRVDYVAVWTAAAAAPRRRPSPPASPTSAAAGRRP